MDDKGRYYSERYSPKGSNGFVGRHNSKNGEFNKIKQIPYGSKDNPVRFNDIATREKLLGAKGVIATHDGRYHNDDLVACALFDIYFDGKLKVSRTRNVKPLNRYTSDIQRNDPVLNHKINDEARRMTNLPEDDYRYERTRKRNYFNLLEEAAYEKHNHQAVPFVLDNGELVYFELDYLVDVGCGELDHHDNQETGITYNKCRPHKPDRMYWKNEADCRFGVKYAAAGLTWRKIGRDVIKKCLVEHDKFKMFAHDELVVEEIFNSIDEELMSSIDYRDNTNSNEYNHNSKKYKAILDSARDIIDFDYELEEDYENGKKTPFELGVAFIGKNLIQRTIRRVALEAMETRRNESKFNEAVNECTNESRLISFESTFKYKTLLRKNPKARFVNFVVMKENDGENYVINFCDRGEYSIPGKPIPDSWKKGYLGIEYINLEAKKISVDSLENAELLVEEFYNYYANEIDATDYKIDSMKDIESNVEQGINKQKHVLLNSLQQGVFKMENALKVLKNSLRVSISEGKYDELLDEITYHENKILEMKKEHNEISKECGRNILYADVEELECEDEFEVE